MTEKNYTFTVDEKKDFDIKLSLPCKATVAANDSDKVKITLASKVPVNFDEYIKVKTNDTSSRFDVKIKAVDFDENVNITFSLPSRFINKVELDGNMIEVLISNIKADNIEISGKISAVEIQNADSHIELNSNNDMDIFCSGTVGKLDINQISANSKLTLSADTSFKAENKGRKTQLIISDDIEQSDDCKLAVELNGIKSNLTITKA